VVLNRDWPDETVLASFERLVSDLLAALFRHLSREAGEVGRGSGREGAAMWAFSARELMTVTLSRALEPDLSRRER
jgi:hypothetical protein